MWWRDHLTIAMWLMRVPPKWWVLQYSVFTKMIASVPKWWILLHSVFTKAMVRPPHRRYVIEKSPPKWWILQYLVFTKVIVRPPLCHCFIAALQKIHSDIIVWWCVLKPLIFSFQQAIIYILFGSLLTEIWARQYFQCPIIVLSISQSVMNQNRCMMACWKGMKKGSKVWTILYSWIQRWIRFAFWTAGRIWTGDISLERGWWEVSNGGKNVFIAVVVGLL